MGNEKSRVILKFLLVLFTVWRNKMEKQVPEQIYKLEFGHLNLRYL